MKTSKLIVAIAFVSTCFNLGAQTSFDAAKLYEEELNGTARYVGMGGAMGALGNDMSVISHNPAGIGLYHNSDINTSVSFFGISAVTDPLASLNSPVTTADGINYASHNNKTDIKPSWDNVSFVFSGYDGGNSYLNVGFSYRTLLNTEFNLDYFDDQPTPSVNGRIPQRDFQDWQRNKIKSYDFNLSCGLSDMLYLGWTIGLIKTDTWSEGFFYDYYPIDSDNPTETKIIGVEKMSTATGSGWNMAVGAVLRPVQALRIGIAVKSPTWFSQDLEYADYIEAYLDKKDDEIGNKDNSVKYKYTSPWSVDLSAGLTVNKTAIGFEYERHFAGRSTLSIDNVQMANQGYMDYKDYSVYKVGIEQNIGVLSLRGGYSLSESLFNENAVPNMNGSDYNFDRQATDCQMIRGGKRQNFSLGFGYCSEPDSDGSQFYFDVAFVHSIKNVDFNINEWYIDSNTEDPTVRYNIKNNKLMFTLGWNF